MNILFCDSSHPNAYDFDTLNEKAIGGTESSLLRIAQILADNNHRIWIWQQTRKQAIRQKNVHFIGPTDDSSLKEPDRIVVLRKDKQLNIWQQRFPKAVTYLWLHTYKKPEFVFKRLFKHNLNSTYIGNSQIHRNHLEKVLHRTLTGRLLSFLGRPKINITYGYNPVPRPTLTSPAKRQTHKLIFISAPNKGLAQVLACFRQVKKAMPDMQLFIANPGYREDNPKPQAGVHYLGPLPQAELWQHVAESLCVFYPQDSFAETFGLIYVEANAFRTPVLAHDIGAAAEILHPKNPTLNVRNTQSIIKTLQLWQQKLPAVNYRQEFSADAIYQQWSKILDL